MASNSQLLALVDRLRHMPPEKVEAVLKRLPADEKVVILELLEELGLRKKRQMATEKFMEFVHAVWPNFIEGRHHIRIANLFEQVARGEVKRLIVNLGPRHTKSQFASYLLPAWYLGKFPHHQVIQASHTAELAVGFGRQVRNLVDSEIYKEIFPHVQLQSDSKAAGRWDTNFGGKYYAVGVSGALAGRGSNLLVIDDPHSEAEATTGMYNPEVYDKVYEWYTSGPRQRLQPNGAIVIVMCVEENQRILLSNGVWKPIKDVVVGDTVAAYDKGSCVNKQVLANVSQGEDDLLEVISRSCSVKVNARHPFLVVTGGVEHTPKTRQDVLQARDWGVTWKRADELVAGDVVVTAKCLGRGNYHRPVRMNSPRQMTQEEYWLFGYLFGDGWLINSGARGVVGFCIAASNHEDIDQYVLGLVRKHFNVDMALTKHGYYRSDNKARGRWLAAKGFCSGAKIKRIPEWIFKLRPCDKREFLRGFLTADGWLRPAKRKVETYQTGLANKELLDDLRLIARTCGVRTTKIYVYEHTCQPPNSRVPIDAVHYSARFTFKDNKLELNHRYRYQSLGGNGTQYFRFETIESVRPAGRGVVHDLTVEGVENFIAEGFVVHNTRWSLRDLTGQVLKSAAVRGSDEWKVVEFPALLPSGEPLWPEFWSKKELLALKEELPTGKWMAQYQQNPISDSSALIKRDWWKWWDNVEPPRCEFIIQSWDTAHETKTVNDYSACTTWGVWYNDEDKGLPNIILLNAFRDRLEFPDLKRVAFQEWKDWEPDSFLIEKKAAGAPLIQEFRAMGIPVQEFSPGKGQDKISRLNAVADIFASGKVWVPRTRWAEEVVDEVAAFPSGEHDDYVDNVSLVLARFRQGGYVTLPSDEPEPIQYFKSNRSTAYY